VKKPKLKKRKNPSAGLTLGTGMLASMMHSFVFERLLARLNPLEQLVVLAAAHAKAMEILGAKCDCPQCGAISVPLSEHTCPYTRKARRAAQNVILLDRQKT
jgi:hypothetical protein